MIVVLAEKPDVATKIAGALDGIHLKDGKVIPFEKLNSSARQINAAKADGYFTTALNGEECLVTWGYGHLCELMQAEDYDAKYRNWRKIPLPLIPARYELKMKTGAGSKMDAMVKSQLAVIKKLFSKADYIINATDYDREGEVIFAYIYEYLKCKKPVKRAIFSSMTKEGFQEAFASLVDGAELKPIESAGRMRSIADWVVGANLTVAMTLMRGSKTNTLSVGRVQTPTLNIVVERELQIRNFKSEPYWVIEAQFTTAAGETYKAQHKTERFKSEDEARAEMEKLLSLQAVAGACTVEGIRKKETTRVVPHLYSLASLQMDCNSKFGMTLKQTLDTAQSLYSKGFTTYPRTSSQYLTEDMGPVVSRVLGSLKTQDAEYARLIGDKKVFYGNHYWFDNSKVDSHYAIIPTGTKPSGMTDYEAKVYDLIARSVIRMLYGNAKLEQTEVITEAKGSQFRSSGSVIVEKGWMEVSGTFGENELPTLSEGDRVTGSFDQKEKKTEPPKRYTDKTLLNAMINCGKEVEDDQLRRILEDPNVNGIGTSATRDSIIETLIKRGFMERRGKTFYATEKGIAFIEGLPLADLKGAELTARWEQQMAEIAHNKADASTFRKAIEEQTRVWTDRIISEGPQEPVPVDIRCPKCGKQMMRYIWGIACQDYNNKEACGFSVGTKGGVIIEEDQIKKLIADKKTDLIHDFVVKTGKRRYNAWLLLNDDYTISFEYEKAVAVQSEEDEMLEKPGEDRTAEVLSRPCPVCGKPLAVFPLGYRCSDEGCRFKFGTACHKRLSDTEVLKYLDEGETGFLEGFISKRGNPFKANLKMRANKTMQYVFDNSDRPARGSKGTKAKSAAAPAKEGTKKASTRKTAAKGTAKSTAKGTKATTKAKAKDGTASKTASRRKKTADEKNA